MEEGEELEEGIMEDIESRRRMRGGKWKGRGMEEGEEKE